MQNDDYQHNDNSTLKNRSGSFNAFKKKFAKESNERYKHIAGQDSPKVDDVAFQEEENAGQLNYGFPEDSFLMSGEDNTPLQEADSEQNIFFSSIGEGEESFGYDTNDESDAEVAEFAEENGILVEDGNDNGTDSTDIHESEKSMQQSSVQMTNMDFNTEPEQTVQPGKIPYQQNESENAGVKPVADYSNTFEKNDSQNVEENVIAQEQNIVAKKGFIDKHFTFQGRSARQEFWICAGAMVIFSFILTAIGGRDATILIMVISSIFMWPVNVRRLHDTNRSGWLLLIGVVPILGSIALFVIMGCMKGTDGPNKYGPDPLQNLSSADVSGPPEMASQDIAQPISVSKKIEAQNSNELKEKVSAVMAAATGVASSFLKTASEKATGVSAKASEMAHAMTEKAPELGNNIANMAEKENEKATELSKSHADNKVKSATENEVGSGNRLNGININNKTIIALVAVALLIGGLGGYILFGRSSDDKKSVAQSQPVPAQQVETNKSVESNSLPKPKPVEPPVQQFRVQQNNPRNAFISFHGAITNRQLADAYNILSPDYQKFVRGYDNFTRGYATTLRSDVVDLNTISENGTSAVLTYKLKAEDQVESGKKVQYFIGKAKLLKINGEWRLDSTEARKATQSSKAPVNLATITAKGEVNLRAYPSTNANSVGVVREGDWIEILETGTCTDSAAAIVISDDIYFGKGGTKTQLSKGMAIQIVSDNGSHIVCRVNVNGRTENIRFAPNHLVKMYGTTWYKVVGNGHTGWIYSQYARKQ